MDRTLYESIQDGDHRALRASRFVAAVVLVATVAMMALSGPAAVAPLDAAEHTSFPAFLEALALTAPYANASEWRVGKVAHAIHADSGARVQAFLSRYVCAEAGSCASDLGCGALRAMCTVRVPWDGVSDDDDAADAGRRGAVNTGHTTAGLHFVDAPALNDGHFPANGTQKGVDFWVDYMEQQHGTMAAFDPWMHSKVQLYASNLSTFVGPLKAAGVATFERSSVDPAGAAVAHVGVNLAGRVVEFVGPAASLAPSWAAPAWAADECPAAHALVSSMRELDDAGGASVDDATTFDGGQGLSLVGLGVLSAAPTAQRVLYRSLRTMSAADVGLLATGDAPCAAVEVRWPSAPHFAVRYVRDDAARAGAYAPGQLDAYVAETHAAFVAGKRGSWDRWLDQHVGLWYSGGAEKCARLVADLHADLAAAGVPYAQRQQADALLVYAGFGSAMSVEYQFADCTSDAPEECACDASNNDATFLAKTGDSCWALGDDWCTEA